MEQTWGDGRHTIQAVLRPDGQWLLRLPDDPAVWAALLARRPAGVDRLLVSTTDETWHQPLQDLQFRATRTEQVWHLPLTALGWPPITSPAHELVPVLDCDLAQVVDLDNAVRHQIPGTEAWTGTVADLRDQLDDDQFDSELYLIAVHRDTGSYDGLVRVWNRHPRPRLGCLGVRPQWRRTRLGPHLLGAVTTTLRERGVAEILTETDLRNPDSHSMAANHGGIRVRQVIEWSVDEAGSASSERGRISSPRL